MSVLLRKINYGLRTQGLGYLVTAPINELLNPRFTVTRHVRDAIISVRDRFVRAPAGSDAWSDDALQFFCDLSASPVTFDFASYLAAAEVERRLRGLANINVIFVLGPYSGVRKELPDYEAAIDTTARLARLRNILVPMLALLPSVKSYAMCGTRQQAEALISADPSKIYPDDYRVYLPRQPAKKVIFEHARAGISIWPMFRATDAGARYVREFLAREAGGRRPVVITLRNYDFSPERNSRNEDWIAFADGLDRSIYAPIFVHDTETAMRPPPADFGAHVICHAASWSLEVRMALYEAAWLNMALMHGPMELCWYNARCRYVLFVAAGVAAANTEAALIENGHRIGANLDFAGPSQRLVWKRDDLPALREAFAMMEKGLPSQSSTSCDKSDPPAQDSSPTPAREGLATMQQEVKTDPLPPSAAGTIRPHTMGAAADLIGGLRKYDLWGRLGWLEIKRRYRRTTIGPFWTCLSLLIFVIVIGSVGSGLLSKQTHEYLPFLVAGMIVWVTLQNVLVESSNVFVSGGGIIRQMNFEYSILVYALVWRNFIVFAHNLLVYLFVFLIFSPEKLGFANLLAIPGLIVLAVNCAWLTLLLGLASLRFRDLQQVIMSVVQVSMFVTPLFWPPEGLEGLRRIFFVGLNPLYHLLTIVRDPLLGGKLPPVNSCIAAALITVVGWGLTYVVFDRFRKRIAYWL